uniref:Uncharacterized protein n=1 Tax=Rhizophora mucronata TaxID=61149 RepID=A0A2P2P797_RHIMU
MHMKALSIYSHAKWAYR